MKELNIQQAARDNFKTIKKIFSFDESQKKILEKKFGQKSLKLSFKKTKLCWFKKVNVTFCCSGNKIFFTGLLDLDRASFYITEFCGISGKSKFVPEETVQSWLDLNLFFLKSLKNFTNHARRTNEKSK